MILCECLRPSALRVGFHAERIMKNKRYNAGYCGIVATHLTTARILMYGLKDAMLRDLTDCDLNEMLTSLNVSDSEYHTYRTEALRRSKVEPKVKTTKPRFTYATNMLTGKDF